jgi:hypothetical protein
VLMQIDWWMIGFLFSCFEIVRIWTDSDQNVRDRFYIC